MTHGKRSTEDERHTVHELRHSGRSRPRRGAQKMSNTRCTSCGIVAAADLEEEHRR